MVVFDDLEASEKIKVYDRGISLNPSPENVYQMLIGYRAGDMWAPQIAVSEALTVEASHFVACIRDGAQPITGGEAGLHVVRLLEAATESMAKQGQLVTIGSAAQS
jgi:predicted dehydrogenase